MSFQYYMYIYFLFQHICRSATLASGAEMYGRSGLDFLFSGKFIHAHTDTVQNIKLVSQCDTRNFWEHGEVLVISIVSYILQ